jgi:hypothetical protein
MQRFIAWAGFVVAFTSSAPASASNVIVPLDISNQSVFWVGEGVNGSGDGQITSVFGTCAPAAGGNSTCNMTGNFAFGGGGTYNLQVIGPSPFQGVETTPTSGFYNINFPNSTLEFTLNFNNGLNATYVDGPGAPAPHFSNFTDSFVSADATCTGVASCSGSLVGATPGSTLSGPVTFTLTVPKVPVPIPTVAIKPVPGLPARLTNTAINITTLRVLAMYSYRSLIHPLSSSTLSRPT